MADHVELAYMRCIIYGKVQGVFFRASTRDKAEQLGILGYAKNLSDGSVEVIACGSDEALDELKAWLHVGPKFSAVNNIECEPIPEQIYSNFTIL